MSIRALAWAMRQELPATTKMVLIVLADHHNSETGQCNPSIKRIAKVAGADDSTVKRHISKLDQAALLTIKQNDRSDGSRTSNTYILEVDNDINILTLGSGAQPPGGGGCVTPLEPSNHVEPSTKETKETHVSLSKKEPEELRETEWRENYEDGLRSEQGDEAPSSPAGRENNHNESGDTKNPVKRRKRVTEVTYEFRLDMEEQFARELSSSAEVRLQIDLALAHQASTKYHDLQTYVRNWLKNAVRYQGGNGGEHRKYSPGNISPEQAETERAERLQRLANERRSPVAEFQPQVPEV